MNFALDYNTTAGVYREDPEYEGLNIFTRTLPFVL